MGEFGRASGLCGGLRKVSGEPPCAASYLSIGVSTESGNTVDTKILCRASSTFSVRPSPRSANLVAV